VFTLKIKEKILVKKNQTAVNKTAFSLVVYELKVFYQPVRLTGEGMEYQKSGDDVMITNDQGPYSQTILS